jgi:hypothetical protein
MADLLSHLLVAYALLTVVSWRVDWLTDRWVVVGTGGAAIPDLVKVEILLDAEIVEDALGVPFAYAPLSTLGGVLLVAGLIALAFDRERWRRAYGLVVAGGLSSLLLDGLRVVADGRAAPYLYPVTGWSPPTPNLYVTSDPRILGVAVVTALAVALLDRRRA